MANFNLRGFRRGVTLLAALSVFALAVPSSRLAAQRRREADRWESAIKKFEEGDRVNPPPQNAIVFIGASSIVRWNLPESFPELGPKAINRGFGGSLAADSTRYADRIVIPYKPRIVVFYAGDNDVEANHTPEQIAGDFSAFEQKVHAALPANADHLHLDQAEHPPVAVDRADQRRQRAGPAVLRDPRAPDIRGHRAADDRRGRKPGKKNSSRRTG